MDCASLLCGRLPDVDGQDISDGALNDLRRLLDLCLPSTRCQRCFNTLLLLVPMVSFLSRLYALVLPLGRLPWLQLLLLSSLPPSLDNLHLLQLSLRLASSICTASGMSSLAAKRRYGAILHLR